MLLSRSTVQDLYSPEFPGHSGGYVAVAGQEGIGINAVSSG
jgi:hypothetical protein